MASESTQGRTGFPEAQVTSPPSSESSGTKPSEAQVSPPPSESSKTRSSEAKEPPRTRFPEAQESKDDNKSKQLIKSFAQHYEIRPEIAERIGILGTCELVILCDDSGSMNIPIQGTTITRWDELRQVVHIAIDVFAAFDSDGVDVYFLNRPPILKVKDTKQVHEQFEKRPDGLTPIVPALRSILQAKYMNATAKKNLLVLIATDGIPTTSKGELDLVEMEKVMRNERNSTTHVTFLACTDEAEALSYLNNWDTSMKNVDVVDDYRSELAQVREKQGPNAKFSFGDYLVKALIGSIDPASMDSLDE